MKRHLLVASAFGAIAQRIEHFFSNRGYRIDTVDGGVDCLREVQRLAPDALILDWDLPWGGGAGVLARLSEIRMAIKMPVILLTENIMNIMDDPVLQAPITHCLQIPCDVRSLYLAVDAALTPKDHSSKPANTLETRPKFLPAYG